MAEDRHSQENMSTGFFKEDIMPTENELPKLKLDEIVRKSASQHYEAAKVLSAESRHESAITRLNKAIALSPNEDAFYAARAESFVKLCDIQSAILNYRKACQLMPDVYNERLAFLYYFSAQCLVEQNLHVEALEHFSRAAELRPDFGGYRIRSVNCLSALGYHENCISLITERINELQLEADREQDANRQETRHDNETTVDDERRKRSIADLFVLRARIHRLLAHTSDCYDDVTSALSLDQSHREAAEMKMMLDSTADELKDSAIRHTLLGRHKDALFNLTKAISTNPSLPDFHILRGAVHRQLGDFNSAIDDYLLAMAKTNHDEESDTYRKAQRQLLLTYNDFAVECLSKEFYDEALLLLNKAIKDEKQEKGLYFNRGECFYKRGEPIFALADYHQALDLDPHDATIQNRIASVHRDCAERFFLDNNLQEADQHLSKALEYNLSSADCYVLRAKIRSVRKDLNGARRDVISAMLLDSCNAEIIVMITRLFPGKTVADIVSSELATEIRSRLEKSSHCRKPMDTGGKKQETKIDPEANKSTLSVALGAGQSDRLFHMKLAMEKKRANQSVKNVLRSSGCGISPPAYHAVPST